MALQKLIDFPMTAGEPVQFPVRVRQRDGENRSRAALEPHAQGYFFPFGQRDVFQQQPGDPLALAIRGGGILPESREITRQLMIACVDENRPVRCRPGAGVRTLFGFGQRAQLVVPSASSVPATRRLSGSTCM